MTEKIIAEEQESSNDVAEGVDFTDSEVEDLVTDSREGASLYRVAVVFGTVLVFLVAGLMIAGVISSHPLQVVAQDGGIAKEAQVKKTETGSDKSASSKSSESKEGTAAADKDKSAAGRSAADDKDAKSPESGGSKSSGANADNGGSGSSGSEKNPGASGTNPGGNGNSKGNSGGGSSSGEGSNAGSGDSGSGAKPKPKREWVPPRDEWVESGHWETKKIKHPAEYGERNIIGARCNDCGFTTAIASEMYAHLEKTFHSGYTTGVVIGTEKYVIKKAWIEEKKVWVDTSRWVHHPGYWKE